MRKGVFLFVFLFIILSSILVSSAPPITEITSDIGYTIEPTIKDYIRTGEDHEFEIHVFNKTDGVRRARLRSNVAQENGAGDKWTQDNTFSLHGSGLFGCVSVDEMPKLLTYFRNVDAHCKESGKNSVGQ